MFASIHATSKRVTQYIRCKICNKYGHILSLAYNDGDSGLIDVIKKIGLRLGMFTVQGY